MPATPTFNPPSPNLEGKPFVPAWVPPPVTKQVDDFAVLQTIDLSKMDSDDPAVVEELVQDMKRAIRDDGFIILTNYGISLEQLHRQFAIAQYNFNNMSDADKERLLFDPVKNGTWSGYKHPYGFKRHRQMRDGIEQFNYYKEQFANPEELVPATLLPFQDEVEAFCNYLTESVNKRILTLFSRILELPDNYLWDNVQSKGSPTGQGYFRYAKFKADQEALQASKGLKMHSHTDFGLTTMLFSVPISCLQIWTKQETWAYCPYVPGALVINVGETLEIVSGGHFKATRHRVYKPPADQMHEERLSLVLFNSSLGDLRMTPAYSSPLIQREGCIEEQGVYKEFKAVMDQGIPVPTNAQWRETQIQLCTDPTDQKMNTLGVHQIMHDGKLFQKREYLGVSVLLPV